MEYKILLATGTDWAIVFGAFSVTLFIVVLISSGLTREIYYFIQREQYSLKEKTMVKQAQELTTEILAFIPAVKRKMIFKLIDGHQYSVIQAVDEVLSAKVVAISCVYSDIRSFSQKSKDFQFLIEEIIPNTRHCATIIESEEGVAKVVGDLNIGYWDDVNMRSNIVNALKAAIGMYNAINTANARLPFDKKIKRYISINTGIARCGNMNSSESSREITAMGTVINKLSKIDNATKTKSDIFTQAIGDCSILITEEALEILSVYGLFPSLEAIDLEALGVSVLDFPEVKTIWKLIMDEKIQEILGQEFDKFEAGNNGGHYARNKTSTI